VDLSAGTNLLPNLLFTPVNCSRVFGIVISEYVNLFTMVYLLVGYLLGCGSLVTDGGVFDT